MELEQQTLPVDTAFWKLGCNWGSGEPSFFEVIRAAGIVLGTGERNFYRNGDIVLVTEGHRVRALAQVISDEINVASQQKLKDELLPYGVPKDRIVIHYAARYMSLSENEAFNYELQQGMVRIERQPTIQQAQELWLAITNDSNEAIIIESKAAQQRDVNNKFKFKAGNSTHINNYKSSNESKTREVKKHHVTITNDLFEYLENQGNSKDDISEENTIIGSKMVDVVLRVDGSYDLFEVKTENSALANIRLALGQILEYALLDAKIKYNRLIIVGPAKFTDEEAAYFERLKSVINVNLEYWAYEPNSSDIEDKFIPQ